jgi:hypothetical protein
LLTPAKAVLGAGTYCQVRYWSIATRSTSRGTERGLEERTELAREGEAARAGEVDERLRRGGRGQQQALPRRVPQREGEHPRSRVDDRVAPRLVAMDRHLGVRPGPEPVAAAFELRAEIDVVVDLAVQLELDRAVLVRQGLRAAGDVDDR